MKALANCICYLISVGKETADFILSIIRYSVASVRRGLVLVKKPYLVNQGS